MSVGASRLVLSSDPASVTTARRFVQQVVRESSPSVPDDVLDAAVLLAAELVTNAVLHARTPLEVTVTAHPDHLRVGVADQSPHLPRMRSHARTATQGRGLRLVAELATAWGIEPAAPPGRGKTVWFELLRDQAPVPTGAGLFDSDPAWWEDAEPI